MEAFFLSLAFIALLAFAEECFHKRTKTEARWD
jgi:hypothetical protein